MYYMGVVYRLGAGGLSLSKRLKGSDIVGAGGFKVLRRSRLVRMESVAMFRSEECSDCRF
jgi:hypothetical protein